MTKRLASTRRKLLKGGAATIAAAALPFAFRSHAHAQSGVQTVDMQLGWISGGNQIGEVVAKRLGYFDEEKINFAIQARRPEQRRRRDRRLRPLRGRPGLVEPVADAGGLAGAFP